jgi:apolipoprotein N-acyltransferase
VLVGGLVVSALLVAAAIRLPELRPLHWISLVPLFMATRLLRPSGAAYCGALWGVILLYGLAHSGGAPAGPHSCTFFVLLPALYSGLVSRVVARVGFRPLLLAAAWLLPELLLHLSSGEQGLVGRALCPAGPSALAAHYMGWLVVVWLIAWVNAALVEWLARWWNALRRRRPLPRPAARSRRVAPADLPWRPSIRSRPSSPRAPPRLVACT